MKIIQCLSLLLLALSTSCKDSNTVEPSKIESAEDLLIVDQSKYDQAWSSLQNNDSASDPFRLNELSHDSTVLNIEVSYGGGCKEHSFELIWPEVITMIYPPRYTVILNHDAHNDLCEAYLTETLHFDLSQEGIGLTLEDMDVIDLTIINGSDGEESLKLNN